MTRWLATPTSLSSGNNPHPLQFYRQMTKTPISEVFNEDCMIGMARYPDKHFDLAIVDPPYGISVGDNKSGMGRRKGDAKAKYKMGDWDHEPPPPEFFVELMRVSKNQIIWGGNYFDLPPTKCFLVWDKLFSNDVSFADCEYAWTSFDETAKMIRKHPSDPSRIHPTQKPVKLYRWILSTFGTGGNKILDTHMGSQSSRIAAYNMGFDYWGWEIDKDYFEVGNKRFKEQTAQIQLL